ncbi:FAD/NAD(P)-binding domain-containing protein [Exidia glandulosa HHB12029]|uniref:FAD/NAD(P)-binding domain-containing protein n=1 Tax=Exidia glandulosa HHB12029 TaxID=1314781 RepID=A0A165CZU3_EXIGL|nr:FAD/NAD(P)-binding domain-containing protein [Exidia glandulosa HHB12029]
MRVAVVGAGAGGIASSSFLNKYSEHEVHLFEAADYAGGHAHAIAVPSLKAQEKHKMSEAIPESEVAWTETAFIVFNTATYPNFCKYLELLGVSHLMSDMSWSVSRDRGAYEWASRGLRNFFVQWENIFSARHWRILWDMLRFNATATSFLFGGSEPTGSIGEFIDSRGYSRAFRDDYFIPLTAAIWSTPVDETALDFPASTLIRFMYNHHLLQISGRPQWLTVSGSSKAYIDRALEGIPAAQKHFNTAIHSVVTSVTPDGQPVHQLTTATGETYSVDHVILACHADHALEILTRGSGPTEEEHAVLSGFTFGRNNRVVMHRDERLMPARKAAWSAWNYLTLSQAKTPINDVSVTFWMNLLQQIPESKFGTVLGTLNPPFEPLPETILGEYWYEHPHMTEKSRIARAALPAIQNKRGITFVGGWTGYGFHEDAVTSAMRVLSEHLSVQLPFQPLTVERSRPDNIKHHTIRVCFEAAELMRREISKLSTSLRVYLLLAVLLVVYPFVRAGVFLPLTGRRTGTLNRM